MTQSRRPDSPLGSRTTLTLLVFLGAAALLLAYEHRVHIFTSTGLLVALLGLCIFMHLFMHGGHGGHGGHGNGSSNGEQDRGEGSR